MIDLIDKQSLSVLIVDDEPKNIQLLGNLLKEEGYQIEFAMDGEGALEWANSKMFDLILLDVMMPEMNGIEVCKRLKQNSKTQKVPVIFLTAKDEPESVVKGFEAGALDYILKPFYKRELLARIETHLEVNLEKNKLKEMHDQLEKQHEEFKIVQSQLIQAEKMAGLGTLVAGVSHEINNPTNFAQNGAINLKDRLEQLKQFIFQLAGKNMSPAIRKSLEDRFQPLSDNLEAVIEGTQRIQTIVQDLRTFSQLGAAGKKKVSVLKGLESTMKLVYSNYNKNIEFSYDYQADPLLDCWPAQLNQVFMNLAVNACQAMYEKQNQKGTSSVNQLMVSTFRQEDQLGICFEDTGIGMAKDIQKKVFEPFFTTKTVGEGTGLGLSVSFGIIEKHHGHIEVESAPGKGTKFTIFLPIAVD